MHHRTAARLGLVVEQALAPVPGGTGRYSVELARALGASRAGRTVRTYCAFHRSVAPARVAGVDGPHRLPLGRRAMAAAWERGLPPAPRALDVIHAPTLLVPWGARAAKVVTIHDAVPWTHPQTLTPRGVRWHRAQAERAARHAAAVVVPTRAVRDELSAVLDFRCPVEVIGSAVAPRLSRPDASRTTEPDLPERYIVAVSTVEPRKGLDVLIKALAAPQCDGIPLVVVGQTGWGGVDLGELVQRESIDPARVIATGRVDDDRLAAIVRGAQLLVMPSRSEGFGIPVVEAMALGTAVVHSDAPALVEIADGAGVSVPRDDPHALAVAIARLWSNPREVETLVRRGRDVAAQHTWPSVAEAHWAVYERALEAS